MIKLHVVGRLGQNAVKRSVNGKTVLNFSVAHNERFKNSQGIPQERTVWVNCAMWEPGNVGTYLVQGKSVYLEGNPSIDVYNSHAGETKAELKVRVTFLQLLPGGAKTNGPADEENEEQPAVSQPADDLPF